MALKMKPSSIINKYDFIDITFCVCKQRRGRTNIFIERFFTAISADVPFTN